MSCYFRGSSTFSDKNAVLVICNAASRRRVMKFGSGWNFLSVRPLSDSSGTVGKRENRPKAQPVFSSRRVLYWNCIMNISRSNYPMELRRSYSFFFFSGAKMSVFLKETIPEESGQEIIFSDPIAPNWLLSSKLGYSTGYFRSLWVVAQGKTHPKRFETIYNSKQISWWFKKWAVLKRVIGVQRKNLLFY